MTNANLHNYARIEGERYYTIEAPRLIPLLHRHTNIAGKIHEPAAGQRHMAVELEKLSNVTSVFCSDIQAAPGVTQMLIEDVTGDMDVDWVVSNLPYRSQDKLMAHLLRVYPNAHHAYLTRSAYLAPARRGEVIHNNNRFAGEVKVSKRPRWFEKSEEHNSSPSVDYSWILFDREGRTAPPLLAFEFGPTVDFFGGDV